MFLIKGDSKEMFTFGSSEGVLGQLYPNEWPLEGKVCCIILIKNII